MNAAGGRCECTPASRIARLHGDALSFFLSQVLLSQVHRLRALDLLGRFLDLGPWAVSLVRASRTEPGEGGAPETPWCVRGLSHKLGVIGGGGGGAVSPGGPRGARAASRPPSLQPLVVWFCSALFSHLPRGFAFADRKCGRPAPVREWLAPAGAPEPAECPHTPVHRLHTPVPSTIWKPSLISHSTEE